MGLVYVGLAPLPADPCAKGPTGWNPYWSFPGPPWAPGWPVTVDAGFSLGLSLGTVNVGSAVALVARVLFNGIDDPTLQCHSLSFSGALNGSLMQLSTDGTNFFNSLAGTVKNFSGSQYGQNKSLYLPLSAGNVGQSGSLTVCVTSTTPPICATVNFTVVSTPLDRGLLLYGGDASGNNLNAAFEYVPSTGVWGNKTSSPLSNTSQFGFGISNKAYMAGGADLVNTGIATVEMFDPSINTWTGKSALAQARTSGSASVGLFGYIVYGVDNTATNITNCDRYDQAGDAWAGKTAGTAPGRDSQGGVVSSGSLVYLCGGQKRAGPPDALINTVAYDTVGDSWAAKANMTRKRAYLGTFVIGQFIYSAGGWRQADSPQEQTNFDKYSIAGDSWATAGSIPGNRRRQIGCFAIGTLGYIGGGEYNSGGFIDVNDFAQYDSIGNAWTTLATMPSVGHGLAGFAVNY